MIRTTPLGCFCGIDGHAALDMNPGPGYNILTIDPRESFCSGPERHTE